MINGMNSAIPSALLDVQKWVASMLVRPLRDLDEFKLPIYDTATTLAIEKYITVGPKLSAAKRIGIYNQQYWFRLLSLMQKDYPTVTRLFGYVDFNRLIAEPYLLKYVPNHWSLDTLGFNLPLWIEEEYKDIDKDLVLGAAMIDLAYERLPFSSVLPPISQKDLDCLNEKLLFLQPSIYLFDFEADLFSFRDVMLKEDTPYWFTHDFPKLTWSNHHYFKLDRKGWEEISQNEYALLMMLQKGATLEQILTDCSDPISIARWFKKWAERSFLTTRV